MPRKMSINRFASLRRSLPLLHSDQQLGQLFRIGLGVIVLSLATPPALSQTPSRWGQGPQVQLAQSPETGPILQTQGILETGDLLAEDNSLYDTYSFTARQGDAVTITLESNAFDTYLLLASPDNQILAQNDDISDSNRNSELSLTLPQDGQYTVIVNAYDETGQGPYRLTVTPAHDNASPPTPEAPGASQSEADALIQQGIQQYRAGQFSQAISTWQAALDQFEAAGNDSRVSDLYNNLGEAYRSIGEYRLALDALERSLALSQSLGAENETGSTLNNLGLAYLDLGRFEPAAGYFEKALAIARQNQNRYGESVALKNLGTTYYRRDDLETALELNQQSLTLRRELNDRYGEAATLNSIALIYTAQDELEKALNLYLEALDIDREVGNRAGESVVLSNIGNLYRRLGKFSEALDIFQQSLAVKQDVGDRSGEGSVQNLMGFTHLAAGNHSAAIGKFEAAIAIWESLRAQDLRDVDKVALFETQTASYNGLQQTLVAQGNTEAALAVAERGRTRALVEQLANQLGTGSRPTAPDLATIRQIAQAQAATLVEYALVDTGLDDPSLYIWVVQPGGNIQFETVDLGQLETPLLELVQSSRSAIGARSRAFNTEFMARNNNRDAESLSQLYEILIEPIADHLPTDPEANVIVIPQGELFLVPFPALQTAQGQYLVTQHTLLTAPSIQTLALTQQLQQSRPAQALATLTGDDLLIVGNPTMPSLPTLVGEDPVPLSPLPGAEQEAVAIAKLFNTTALTGADATETSIKRRLSSARLIHLATHGLLEYGQLETTGSLEVPGAVALASDGREDGLLTAEELFQLSLTADLVVLSACDTGLGNITGDGVIGLGRSLMTAGVPSVVVSLWSVPDAPTATLMTAFYEHLRQGQPKAQALRQAMLATQQEYPEPSAWAAFTLMGE